ncbi:hypothetical protein PDE_07711 [Penicillium oxalicum 114-2]|uniref:Uncharacterized protein n=1 Tax=Penicillium oxalicum (strain 114-2 / CGMCC 5302) TaxID=933388 RepID=S7ZVG9_PENO1|nr:hypothetical protein PDE_07711 [Penicillium oxalicum 114-2]
MLAGDESHSWARCGQWVHPVRPLSQLAHQPQLDSSAMTVGSTVEITALGDDWARAHRPSSFTLRQCVTHQRLQTSLVRTGLVEIVTADYSAQLHTLDPLD